MENSAETKINIWAVVIQVLRTYSFKSIDQFAQQVEQPVMQDIVEGCIAVLGIVVAKLTSMLSQKQLAVSIAPNITKSIVVKLNLYPLQFLAYSEFVTIPVDIAMESVDPTGTKFLESPKLKDSNSSWVHTEGPQVAVDIMNWASQELRLIKLVVVDQHS